MALHGKPRSPVQNSTTSSTAAGSIIRWPSLYDVLVPVLTLGRARVFREGALDLARVSPGEHVLDVGCGTGQLALAAKRRVGTEGTVHDIDAGAEMVASARQKAARAGLEVTIAVAPAQALPFEDGAFDLVLCTLMMHHLPRDGRKQAIREMRRVLRPKGRLLILDLAQEKGFLASLNPIALVHGHKGMQTAREAEALMRDAGFTAVVAGRTANRAVGYALGTQMP